MCNVFINLKVFANTTSIEPEELWMSFRTRSVKCVKYTNTTALVNKQRTQVNQ